MNVPVLNMASVWTPHFNSLSIQPSLISITKRRFSPPNLVEFRSQFMLSHSRIKWNRPATTNPMFQLRAVNGSVNSDDIVDSKDTFSKLQEMITTLPPIVYAMKRRAGRNFVIWICVAMAFVVIAVRVYVVRKSRYSHPGSVADLVRRGQLRCDRRGISTPLKYDDPFNNPLVKVSKSNSSIEMCGKVYRLEPVTLTKEQQAIHQKRRSRAYQWKRPTIFLKEGDSIPPDVDPDIVRWIPANHPFATTASDIDENLAQNNVYQKHGVPFRIQAEHEALQQKLEALQNEQKLNNLVIDTGYTKDFERPFKFNPKSKELIEQNPLANQAGDSTPSKSNSAPNSFDSSSSSEDMQKP